MPSSVVSPTPDQRWLDLILISISKLSLVFPDRISRPYAGYIPYEFSNIDLIRKIEKFFYDGRIWKNITLDDIKDQFDDEYWSFVHYIGWDGLAELTPLFLKIGYEAYVEGDEFCRTVEHIYSKLPQESDDKTKTIDEWMDSFDSMQILSIIELMTIVHQDPMKKYPDGFSEGYRQWLEFYIKKIEF